ncbi:unnamed protein product [Clonostachys byssicola]|uniref:Uncharacterized protein n=1 Tax=Clonostachys byssicola TaxID=160290 RepID=A0A9N9U6A9_9HYPO|nr:unnamed protein product [Clonostachys byssicola]
MIPELTYSWSRLEIAMAPSKHAGGELCKYCNKAGHSPEKCWLRPAGRGTIPCQKNSSQRDNHLATAQLKQNEIVKLQAEINTLLDKAVDLQNKANEAKKREDEEFEKRVKDMK